MCRHCGGRFGPKWVRHASCWKCRFELKAAGKCPIGYENGRHCVVCPHKAQCLHCERGAGASCSACRLLFAPDLEDGVAGLVEELRPDLLFVDWDRTLCETKSGCAPVLGKHGPRHAASVPGPRRVCPAAAAARARTSVLRPECSRVGRRAEPAGRRSARDVSQQRAGPPPPPPAA